MEGINQINRVRSLINNYTSTSDPKQKNDLLRQLKLMILTFSTLPPSNKPNNIDEFVLAREIFELEMENSLNNKNEREFELAYLKIKQFYFDFKYSYLI